MELTPSAAIKLEAIPRLVPSPVTTVVAGPNAQQGTEGHGLGGGNHLHLALSNGARGGLPEGHVGLWELP